MHDQTLRDQIIERAMKDPTFRQAVLQDPGAVLAREYNFHSSRPGHASWARGAAQHRLARVIRQ